VTRVDSEQTALATASTSNILRYCHSHTQRWCVRAGQTDERDAMMGKRRVLITSHRVLCCLAGIPTCLLSEKRNIRTTFPWQEFCCRHRETHTHTHCTPPRSYPHHEGLCSQRYLHVRVSVLHANKLQSELATCTGGGGDVGCHCGCAGRGVSVLSHRPSPVCLGRDLKHLLQR
jgi:hypothetical protein